MFRHRPLIQSPEGMVIAPVRASEQTNAAGTRTYLAGDPPQRFTIRELAWLADVGWSTMELRVANGWHWSQLGLDFTRWPPPKRTRRKKLAGRTVGGVDIHRRATGSLEYRIGDRWFTARELAAGAAADGWSIADITDALKREPEHFFVAFAERMAFAKRAEPRNGFVVSKPRAPTVAPVGAGGRRGNPFTDESGRVWTANALARAHGLSPVTIAQRRRRGLTGADLIAPAWSIRDMPPQVRDLTEKLWSVKHAEAFLRQALAAHGRALAAFVDSGHADPNVRAGLHAALKTREHQVDVWRERVRAAQDRERNASQKEPRKAPEGRRGWHPPSDEPEAVQQPANEPRDAKAWLDSLVIADEPEDA